MKIFTESLMNKSNCYSFLTSELSGKFSQFSLVGKAMHTMDCIVKMESAFLDLSMEMLVLSESQQTSQ